MLNEEEKEAIERIEDTFYQDLGKGINKFQKITLYEDGITDIKKLLNLIDKLQKEIEEYQKCFEDIVREQKKQMQMQKELWKRLKGE